MDMCIKKAPAGVEVRAEARANKLYTKIVANKL